MSTTCENEENEKPVKKQRTLVDGYNTDTQEGK